MPEKKRWSDLSPTARKAIIVAGGIEAIVTSVALRDLIRRPASEVRGRKPLWFLGLFVQPIGPVLYLRAGRRRLGV